MDPARDSGVSYSCYSLEKNLEQKSFWGLALFPSHEFEVSKRYTTMKGKVSGCGSIDSTMANVRAWVLTRLSRPSSVEGSETALSNGSPLWYGCQWLLTGEDIIQKTDLSKVVTF
jgi:hypothetical protein